MLLCGEDTGAADCKLELSRPWAGAAPVIQAEWLKGNPAPTFVVTAFDVELLRFGVNWCRTNVAE